MTTSLAILLSVIGLAGGGVPGNPAVAGGGVPGNPALAGGGDPGRSIR